MKTSKEQLQSALISALNGKRFASSKIQILNIESESGADDGTTSLSGGILFFDNEMKMAATVQEADNSLVSLSITPNVGSLINTTIDLIANFLAGDGGIDGGHQLKDFFPDKFPLGFISLQQIEMGFAQNGSSPMLNALSIAFGTGSDWTMLDTRSFDVKRVNVVLSNDDLTGFSNTSMGIEGQFFVNSTAFDLSVGNVKLSSPANVLRELEMKATITNVAVPVDELMHKVLPTEAYQMWEKLTPNALKNPYLNEFTLLLQPGSKTFHILLDSNLGGFEVMSQPVKGTGKRNVLIAVAPPAVGGGDFFGNIDRSLAKLDTLELKDSGIVFSSFEDEVELMLPALQSHTIGDAPLEVINGIQCFAKIQFRAPDSSTYKPSDGDTVKDGEDEKMLQEKFNLGDTYFTLYGSIEKDFTTTLEVGVDFGSQGFQIIPNQDELILREVNIALILQPVPGYVGFRVSGVVDSHLKFNEDYQVDLRFGSHMEFGVAAGPRLIMGGGLEIMALNGTSTLKDGEPAIWENAFGVPGLGLQEIGGNLKMGLLLATVIPPPTLEELGYKGTLLIGTVAPEQRVYAKADVELDTDQPMDSTIKAKLHNTSLIDLIEAYDTGNKFNLDGPVRDLLNVGFRELDIIIDPKQKMFYFNVGLKSGGINGEAEVKFSETGIFINGTIDPLIIEIPGISQDLFAVRGTSGPISRPTINLNLDFNNPTEAKFIVDGHVSVLGGEAIGGSAQIEITPQKVHIETDVQIFGGAFNAHVKMNGHSFSKNGAGMRTAVEVHNDVLEKVQTQLKSLLDTAYENDKAKITALQDELKKQEGNSVLAQIAQGALSLLSEAQDLGKDIGDKLTEQMTKVFNIDHIRFDGNLDLLGSLEGKSGSFEIEAEVQVTIAGKVINKRMSIDFSKGIGFIAGKIKDLFFSFLDFVKEGIKKIKDGLKKLGDLIKQGAEAIKEFAENAVKTIAKAFKDLLKAIEDAFNKVGDAFDDLFKGPKVPFPHNGGQMSFPPGIRHYEVTLEKIHCTEASKTKAKIFGTAVVNANGTMNRANAGNLVMFGARRGSELGEPGPNSDDFDPNKERPLKMAKGDTFTPSNKSYYTKHFYGDEGENHNITIKNFLRQRGGLYYLGDTVKTVSCSDLKWEYDKDNSKAFSMYLHTEKTGKDDKPRYAIRVYYKITLRGKVSAATMMRHILEPLPTPIWPGDSPPKPNIEIDFNHGGDPTFPGLMETAISKDSPYLERMQLLLNKTVTPVSSDISKAIQKGRWDAFRLLLNNGAKPVAKHIEDALGKNIPISDFEKLLAFDVTPTDRSLTLALGKTSPRYAKAILSKPVFINSSNLVTAIGFNDLELLKMMLDKVALNEINSSVLLTALNKNSRSLVLELLKAPITDQSVFQSSLEKVATDLHQTYFDDFISAGARLQRDSIIDNLLEAFRTKGVTQTLVNGILTKALQNGADATYALGQATQAKYASVAKWDLVLKACLNQKVQPDAAISYAINRGQVGLLQYVFGNMNLLSSKATHALQSIVEKSLASTSGNRDVERALAKVVLDAGADPNAKTNADQTFLYAVGNTQRYQLVAELLDLKSNNKRLPIITSPGVFLAIKKTDDGLLNTLIDGDVNLSGEPRFVEAAVTESVGHPLVPILLQNGAMASTNALSIALGNKDFTTVQLLINAGAKGTPALLNNMMNASNKAVLTQLRTTTIPDLGNFQLAADLNKTDYFEILAGADGQLTGVAPLAKAIENRNKDILKNGLSIGWPNKDGMATEALAVCIQANWTEGLIVCLQNAANPAAAVTHAVNLEDADILRRIIADFGGNADQALTDCLNMDKDALLPIPLNAGAAPNTHLARVADAGQESRVRLFLEHGADANLAMMGTIRNENPPLVQHLLDKGANATKPWYLELAIEVENVPIIEILLGAGAKGNTTMLNNFMEADQKPLLVTMRKFVAPDLSNFQRAADLNRADFFEILATPDGLLTEVAPLNTAAKNRNLEILDIGLGIGYPSKKDLADQALTACITEDWKNGVIMCLQHGAAPAPAVTYAVDQGDENCLFRVLNEFGGDADSALTQSLDKNQEHLLPIALGAGADPNTHMVRVAEAGEESRVRLFVQYGGEPDPAMPGTIRNENAPLLQHLIDKGANAADLSYLDLAIQVGHDPVLKVLLENVPSPVDTPIRELNFFSQLVIRFGGLYSILGWSLALVVSLVFWATMWGWINPHILVILLAIPAAVIGLIAIVKNQQIGSRAVKLLRKGKFAWGILVKKEDTSQSRTSNWATNILNWMAYGGKKTPDGTTLEAIIEYKAKFFNHSEQGPYFANVEATQQQGLGVEDEKREPVLYLQNDPQRSVMLDSIAHAPKVLEDGKLEQLPANKWVYLILPFLVLVGNIVCLVVYL